MLVASPIHAQNGFITTWKTDNPGSSDDDQIFILLSNPQFGFDFTVDWGDGTTTDWQDGDDPFDLLHTYPSAGTYTVEISGDFPGIRMGNDRQKLLSVEQWGDIAWGSMYQAFFGASNLVVNATDAPDLSGVTDLSGMFRSASSMNSDLNNWDVSNVTEMNQMFRQAHAFNGDISDWDVSAVEQMSAMFWSATAFNGDIGGWDVGNVTQMNAMFTGAIAFNQDIGAWDVSNVETMAGMFQQASMFNQDVGTWDVSAVLAMDAMFSDASAFNQSLGAWNVENVGNMLGMLKNAGLSTTNYDATLIGWAGQSVVASVNLTATGLTYCAGAEARQSLIDDDNWFISGDSVDPTCPLADEATPEEIVEGLTAPHPNPAHATTTITVAVEHGQDVTIEVFDALGRRVRTLHNGALAAGTSETLALDVSALPAGVYTIRAVGDAPGSGSGSGFVRSRRVTVVR